MSETLDLAKIARMLAEQAEKLDRARGGLREHPEELAEVVDRVTATLSSLDRVITAAGTVTC